MLQRKNGATLAEIMEKMGWQRDTVRGFMAGAMKKAHPRRDPGRYPLHAADFSS
jgi:hypothetical protein